MLNTITSPLAVCVLPPPRNAARTVSYPQYIHEILGHAGLCCVTAPLEELPARLPNLRLLLTVGEGTRHGVVDGERDKRLTVKAHSEPGDRLA